MTLSARLKGRISNIHIQGKRPDIFAFSAPRSGSTFLLELLYAQKRMKVYNEPLNINKAAVREQLGIDTWEELTCMENREALFEAYFRRLMANAVPALNVPFYRRTSRFFTTRHTFKIMHGAEDMIDWFRTTFAGRILVLVRHPISTTFSHKIYPRLPYFLKFPPLRDLFSKEQLREMEKIIAHGDHFERGIVNWCLQNYPALNAHRHPDWAVVSYEDLTMYPEKSVAYLEEKLDLDPTPDLERIVNRPSFSTVQSDKETKKFFAAGGSGDRQFLIEKWRKRIRPGQEERCFEILDLFGMDFYERGNLYPADRYRVPGVLNGGGS